MYPAKAPDQRDAITMKTTVMLVRAGLAFEDVAARLRRQGWPDEAEQVAQAAALLGETGRKLRARFSLQRRR